eukprot:COSAG01_NODE_5541_length_4196_cov_18.251892_2_plen_41_part_00
MGVILLWVCVFPRESLNPILVALLRGPWRRGAAGRASAVY